VLTLYRGRYTTARRSSPVPQLQCVGGSAGCGSFVLEVVQCYNRGSDGIDTQWECKADMDNTYRFGRVEVSCEGYTSPNDAYVLRGSCGLEYTLELTAEGKQQHTHGTSGFSDFASNFFQGSSNQKQQQRGGHYQQSNNQYPFQNGPSGDGVGGLVVVAFLLLVAYVVYKMFLCSPTHGHQGYHGDGSQGYPGTWDNSHGMEPPPPGFKPDYYSGNQTVNESIYLSIYLSICYLSICLSCLSVCLSVVSIYLSIYLSVCVCLYNILPFCLSICLKHGECIIFPVLWGLSADQSSSRPGYGFSDAYTRPQSSWTGFTGRNTGGRGGGGFWTGMGTGGILGYLFGNQRRQPPMGFTGPSYTNRPSPAPKTSSGTRTASGFGGTKRR
ncbi:hypothetical protein cypCar_00028197, partial [Cyprinus carpio]